MIFDDEELRSLQQSTISLTKALEYSTEARVICSAEYPNVVLHANKAWTLLTSYEQHEIAGKNLSILQGPYTSKENIKQMMHNLRLSGFGSADVVNYTKNGEPFFCKISIEPIIDEDIYGKLKISNYLGVLSDYELILNMSQLIGKMKMSKEREEGYEWMQEADIEKNNDVYEGDYYDEGDIDEDESVETSDESSLEEQIINHPEYDHEQQSSPQEDNMMKTEVEVASSSGRNPVVPGTGEPISNMKSKRREKDEGNPSNDEMSTYSRRSRESIRTEVERRSVTSSSVAESGSESNRRRTKRKRSSSRTESPD